MATGWYDNRLVVFRLIWQQVGGVQVGMATGWWCSG